MTRQGNYMPLATPFSKCQQLDISKRILWRGCTVGHQDVRRATRQLRLSAMERNEMFFRDQRPIDYDATISKNETWSIDCSATRNKKHCIQ